MPTACRVRCWCWTLSAPDSCAFCEEPRRIGASDYNQHRLALFVDGRERFRQRPIVSSTLFRGRMDDVRTFYRKLFIEFVGRAEPLGVSKSIQRAVNKLCHGGGF